MPILVGVASLVSEILFYFCLLLIMMQFYIFASCLMLITDYMSLTTFSFHLISNEDKWNHSLSLSLSLSLSVVHSSELNL